MIYIVDDTRRGPIAICVGCDLRPNLQEPLDCRLRCVHGAASLQHPLKRYAEALAECCGCPTAGYDIILNTTGRDATEDFEEIGHSNAAREMLDKYLLGDYEVSHWHTWDGCLLVSPRLGAADTSWAGGNLLSFCRALWGMRGQLQNRSLVQRSHFCMRMSNMLHTSCGMSLKHKTQHQAMQA